MVPVGYVWLQWVTYGLRWVTLLCFYIWLHMVTMGYKSCGRLNMVTYGYSELYMVTVPYIWLWWVTYGHGGLHQVTYCYYQLYMVTVGYI